MMALSLAGHWVGIEHLLGVTLPAGWPIGSHQDEVAGGEDVLELRV